MGLAPPSPAPCVASVPDVGFVYGVTTFRPSGAPIFVTPYTKRREVYKVAVKCPVQAAGGRSSARNSAALRTIPSGGARVSGAREAGRHGCLVRAGRA